MTSNCPYCSNLLDVALPFCINCGRQVRCKSCTKILALNAKFCGECGTEVGKSNDVPTLPNESESSTIRNIIRYEEKGKNRSLFADLTDKSVASLREPLLYGLGGMLSNRGEDTPKNPRKSAATKQLLPPTELPVQTSETNIIEGEVFEVRPNAPDTLRISKIFETDENDELKLSNPSLKAKGKGLYTQALTHLFLYANELKNNNKVTRTTLKNLLTNAGVYDAHLVTWLNKTPHPTLIKEGDSLRLNEPGRIAAKKVLDEFFDESIKTNFDISSIGSKTRRKSKGKEASNTTGASTKAKTSSLPQDVSDWASKWRQISHNADTHSMFNDKSSGEKCVLGLWAICKVMDNQETVVSRAKIVKFLNEAFGLGISDSGPLSNAIAKEVGKINKVEGGYRLLPGGINYGKEEFGKKIHFEAKKK